MRDCRKRKINRHWAAKGKYIGSVFTLLVCITSFMPKERVNAFGLTRVTIDSFTMLREIRAFETMHRAAEQLITDVSIKSNNAMPTRAVQGDIVTVTFRTQKELESITATIDGQTATIEKKADLQYEASIIVDEVDPTIGLAKFVLSCRTTDSGEEYQVYDVTDGSSVFLSDVTNIIDVLGEDTEITGAINQTTDDMLWEMGGLFDHDIETVSELSADESGNNACVIFDFKKAGVNLSRVELLSSQDETYESMEGLTVFGSNDGEDWSQIADGTATDARSWQVLTISENQTYRYIKMANTKSGTANMAELRLFDKRERKIDDTLPKVTTAKIFSDNTDETRACQENVINIMFDLNKKARVPGAMLNVVINGEKSFIIDMGAGTYYTDCMVTDDNIKIGYVDFSINYKSITGKQVVLANKSTNGSSVFLSDETNLIDLLKEDINIFDQSKKVNSEDTQQEVIKLLDNNPQSYSEFDIELTATGKNDFVVFDFKDEGVQLSRVELLARQDDYYSRIEGTIVSGSNDNKNWKQISDSSTKNLKSWQVLSVSDPTEYRYIKIENANAWHGNMAELRLFDSKERATSKELPVITEVSVYSDNEHQEVAYPGDTITLVFKTEEEVPYYDLVFNVLASGQIPVVKRIGECTYAIEREVVDYSYAGELAFTISYCNLNGKLEGLTSKTTDGSTMFITNNDHLIDVLGEDVEFIDSSNRGSSATTENANKAFDKEYSTFSEITLDRRGEGAYLILDFKDKETALERIEVLPRQDDLYTRIEGLTVYGSNDGLNWSDISYYSADSKKSWQQIHILGNVGYRYIKFQNDNEWYGNIAELRLFRSTELEEEEEDGEKNITLGLGSVGNPTSTTAYAEKWTGSKLYFGQKGSDGILWRVLDKDNDGGVFLFADDNVEEITKYHHKFVNTTWALCSLRSYLNGSVYVGSKYGDDEGKVIDYSKDNFINKHFKDNEFSNIKETIVTTAATSNGMPGGDDATDKIFLLSIKELESVKYGFSNANTRRNPEGEATESWWWTRSPATRSRACAAYVDTNGSINKPGINVAYGYLNNKGVRPACNLDASSVLFTSSASVSKVSYTNFGSEESLVKRDTEDSDTWKVTLQGTEQTLEVSTTDSIELPQGNQTSIDIQHKPGSILKDAERVSAILVDSEGNVVYYGKINDDLEATNSTVMIPKTLSLGKYTLKVFAETINGNHATDFATAFSDLELEVVEAVPVEEILDLPDGVVIEDMMNLNGMVQPQNASFQKIEYVVKYAGFLNVYIEDGVLYVGENEYGGVIVVTAMIQNGLLDGNNYSKDFLIHIDGKEAPHFPVYSILGIPNEVTAGEELVLNPEVQPNIATNQEVVWSLKEAGITMAKIDGNVFVAERAGAAIITATVKDGESIGTDFTQEFVVKVKDQVNPGPTVTPMPTPTESTKPTESPSIKPTESARPTESPSAKPTESAGPTESPSVKPTESAGPTESPSVKPTESAGPIESPSVKPTESAGPTESPSVKPTESVRPTGPPSVKPTELAKPTMTPKPTVSPSKKPTVTPAPTAKPTAKPVQTPVVIPSKAPTKEPTKAPVAIPTPITTESPTVGPTVVPEETEQTLTHSPTPTIGQEVENAGGQVEKETKKMFWWWIIPLISVTFIIDRKYRRIKDQNKE